MARGDLSRSQTRQMFDKMVAQKAANKQHEIDEAARRRTCPIEIAKTFLRSRGFHVFAARILPGERSGCEHIMVGSMRLAPSEVIEMAARVKGRMTA